LQEMTSLACRTVIDFTYSQLIFNVIIIL